MNNKKMPPAPVLPPSVKISENYCFFHKGEIIGSIYTCPRCKTNYCSTCAKEAQSKGIPCVKCKQLVLM